jgi:hypothetical protein
MHGFVEGNVFRGFVQRVGVHAARGFPADAGFVCHKSAVLGAAIKGTLFVAYWAMGIVMCLAIIQFAFNHNFMVSVTLLQVFRLRSIN